LVKQYQKLMEMEGIRLIFETKALKAIVQESQKRKTGARALRSIMENHITDLLFETPSRHNVEEIVVSEDMIMRGAKPKLRYRKQRA